MKARRCSLCHLYLGRLSRDKAGRIYCRGTAITATSALLPDSSFMACLNCSKVEHYRNGCAVPAKADGKRINRSGQKTKSGSEGSAGQKRCITHRTSTHNDAECCAQGTPRSQMLSVEMHYLLYRSCRVLHIPFVPDGQRQRLMLRTFWQSRKVTVNTSK